MIEGIASFLSGGATGLLGSALGRVFNYFEHKQKIAEKKIDYEQELKLIERQSQLRMAEQQLDNEHRMDVAEEENYTHRVMATYEHDSNFGEASQWVVNILRLVRPVLTLVLIFGAYWMAGKTEAVTELTLANQALALAGMSVSWWFGDRSKK